VAPEVVADLDSESAPNTSVLPEFAMQRLRAFLALASFLFGNRATEAAPPATEEDPVEMCLDDGTLVLVRRSDYRGMVLDAVEKDWNDPDALYGHITQGLADGLDGALQPAAERLATIDNGSERATCALAIVRSRAGDNLGAKRLLESFAATHRSGFVLTNLAQILYAEGDRKRAIETVRQGLSIDPNQDTALAIYGQFRHEEGGNTAFLAAMDEIAREPGSWRPLLWIARDRLQQGNTAAAIELDRLVLDSGGIDAEGMMMLTGDLGAHGQLDAMLELALPKYDVARHGPLAGLNLARACAERGRRADSLSLCDALTATGRRDLVAPLASLRESLEASPP